MNLSNIANVATIGGFILFVILTVIDRWPQMIKKDSSILSKISLVILIIAVIAAGLSYFSREKSSNKSLPFEWQSTAKILIRDKTFRKERVLLDGHSYSNCIFDNVTLVYRGNAPFDLINITFHGAPDISVKDNPSLGGLVKLMLMLQDKGLRPQLLQKSQPAV